MVNGGNVDGGHSDSNSDVSASESVAYNRANPYICEEGKYHEKGNSMAFIDFLGVGAT